MDLSIDEMKPVTGPVTNQNTQSSPGTQKATKVREISAKQAITLEIVNQRIDKPWY